MLLRKIFVSCSIELVKSLFEYSKTFLYSSEYGPAIFAGYLIKFELNNKIIIPQYLLLYTKSPLFKKWINSNMRVSAQPNINSKQYLDAPIIVPDMDVQEKIVRYS